MKDVKIVIGANYGDEGKGLMTRHFVKEAKRKIIFVAVSHIFLKEYILVKIKKVLFVKYAEALKCQVIFQLNL